MKSGKRVIKKEDFRKLFEDVNVPNQNNQQTQQVQENTEKPKDSKEDKEDRLKKYQEYWNFEKNYHYNSEIDSIIKKINQNYNLNKEEQVKLMKDVIQHICGTAAKYLGLSWDMIGDNQYLFGFYETTGSKNHMQILIPYDFKFSSLKQKLLEWFLKKKEKQNDMTQATEKPKKPSIKVVESYMNKRFRKKLNESVNNGIDSANNDNLNNQANTKISWFEFLKSKGEEGISLYGEYEDENEDGYSQIILDSVSVNKRFGDVEVSFQREITDHECHSTDTEWETCCLDDLPEDIQQDIIEQIEDEMYEEA